MKFLGLLLFVIQSSYASTVFYKDSNFELRESKSNEKTVIFFEGLIRKPLAEQFQKLVDQSDLRLPIELRFNSEGGSIYETQAFVKIIDTLKEKNVEVNTRVDLGSMCASNCVPLFVQGKERIAGSASSFMFHGVAMFAITNIPDQQDTQIMINFYKRAGINESWIQKQIDLKVWSTPSETWYNGKELLEDGSNFVTKLLNNRIEFEPYNRDYSNKPR